MPVACLNAVQKLACAIRANLPQRGEESNWEAQVIPVFLQDLPRGRGNVDEWSCQQTFSVLLEPLTEDRYHTPDGWLLQAHLEAVGAALRDVVALEPEARPEYEYFRALFDQLLQAPLYWWRWTGKIPCHPDPDNPDSPGTPCEWRPIKTGLCAVDGRLLDDLVSAAERCWLATSKPGAGTTGSSAGSAALAILRERKAQGQGGMVGKEIVKALAGRGIQIAEPTFRRYIVPQLKDQGVRNERARGGYYLP